MRPSTISLLLMLSVSMTSCSTPTAHALQAVPSPTSYWSFLRPLQTSGPSATPFPAVVGTVHSPTTVADTATIRPTDTTTAILNQTSTPIESPLPRPTDTPTAAATTPVTNLRATVTAHLLSCRYGPGPNYLYLYALRQGANIKLIGRTDADNWHWAWVEGRNRCWVNVSYLNVQGDWRQLPIVYPGIARLPVSPYYVPPRINSVVRNGNYVTVEWLPIRLRAGDEEDEFMQLYVLEVWHCQGGNLIFEPLATNYTSLTVVDEPGCALPSHARLFFQEKHGFAGPTEVLWRLWE